MVKNRAFLIIIAGAFFFYMVLSYFLSPNDSVSQEPSRVDSAPRVKTAPGTVTDNQRYIELQEKNNTEQAQQAKKDMKSFVPTLVNRAEDEDSELLDKILEEKRRKQSAEEDARQKAIREAQELSQRRLKEQQERMDKLRQDQDERRAAAEKSRKAEQAAKDRQKVLDDRKKVYMAKISDIEAIVTYSPVQSYVASNDQGSFAQSGNTSSVNDQDTSKSAGNALYKAGTILYAVLETSLNTDEPSPILAKITSGPLKGSRLIGSTTGLATQWSQAVVLEFSTISIPFLPSSMSISAIAVDPETARTALADEVNNHYLQRYGAIFFSKIIEGYSQAIQSSGSSSQTNSDGSTVTSNSETTDAENFFIALGNVGTALGQQVSSLIDREPTIKMNQGTAIGLLLLEDFNV